VTVTVYKLQGMPESNNLMDSKKFGVCTISCTWILLQTAY